jgi:hypothetical protein
MAIGLLIRGREANGQFTSEGSVIQATDDCNLALLPAILTHTKCAFACQKLEARAEAVAEVTADACQAYDSGVSSVR